MSFATPLGLLLLLAVPVIIVLHLFRQERRREVVSSLFLWREISDQTSRRIRPRLLRNIHLLLQILAAIAAALALSEPSLVREGIAGSDQLIIVVDTSASMQAESEGRTLFETAVTRARTLATTSRSERITLVRAGAEPSLVLAPTANTQAVDAALDRLTPAAGSNDLDRLVDLIAGIEGSQSSDIVVVTDSSGAAAIARLERWPQRYSVENLGGALANRGITAFELREQIDGGTAALIGVGNYGPEAATVTLRITVDDEALTTEELDLAAWEERFLTTTIPRTSGTYVASLVGNSDALAVDDDAYASARSDRPVRIQLVTGGNLFLESFFSIFPQTELTVTTEVQNPNRFDVIVLDQLPAPAGLRGNVITFGPGPPDGPFRPGSLEEVNRAVSTLIHPVTENAQLAEVSVSRAWTGELDPRATVLMNAGEQPLMYAWRGDTVAIVGILFSLSDSNLALRGSFPVLMNNAISWLAPTGPAGDTGYVTGGTTVPLYVPPGEVVVITQPDGTPLRSTPDATPFRFSRTEQAGIYQLLGESFRGSFAVSLASADESRLIPEAGAIASRSPDVPDEVDTDRTGMPVWHLFALAALLFLAVDWAIWARRT